MDIERVVVRLVDTTTNLRGFATVTLIDGTGDAFVVDGFKIMTKKDGSSNFVSFPSVSFKNKEGATEYKDTAFPTTAELRDKITKAILNSFEHKKNKPQKENVPSPKEDSPKYNDDDLLPF